jgi:aryl-alcohol dehydrogenase-like predicted oxidoreductase/predicted kinase
MRLSTDEDRNEERAVATIAAAAEAGVTVFDTARAYGLGPDELGHNEGLLAGALRASGAAKRARVVTKGGMTRAGGRWIPDGRAKAIRADAEASLEALDGLPIDLYLLHAPDPRTPWSTSVRALTRLLDEGLVRHIGVANVNRAELDEALDLAPVTVVQSALSPFDDTALRSGILDRCVEAGITFIAHSPLGGPRRVGRLSRLEPLAAVAAKRDATAAEVALAWLLGLSAAVIAIPGARRPETSRSAARAATIQLDEDERALLASSLGGRGPSPSRSRPARGQKTDVVLAMGVPGAGKTRVARELVAAGYLRLNRDERGGSLRELAADLDEALFSGATKIVLDNTYLTRASRSYVVEAGRRHGASVRCIWLDTPLAQAQVNLVERLLDRFDGLPTPEELRAVAKREPGLHTPTTQMRTFRELEPPEIDEGFADVEQVPFVRTPTTWGQRSGVLVGASALESPGWEETLERADPTARHLIFDWKPGGSSDDLTRLANRLTRVVTGSVENALCPHQGGPPICWCRPPLPGLPLAFARAQRIDPSTSLLVGTSPAHKTLARTLGCRFVGV